jgi:hypothetical protein
LVDTFLRYAQNSFENLERLSTNRKKGIKIQIIIVHALPVFKRFFTNPKVFGVQQPRT